MRIFFCICLFTSVLTKHLKWKDGEIDFDFQCPDQGLYPIPDENQFYYNCWDNVAYIQRCPQGLYFNPETRNCDYEDKTQYSKYHWKVACSSQQPLLLTTSGKINTKYLENHDQHLGNLSCSWIIIAPPYHRISLNFIHFNLENSQNCSREFLNIHDGTCENDSLLARFCGQQDTIWTPIISSKNKVRLFFMANDIAKSEGFNVEFQFLDERDLPTLSPPVIADAKVACSPSQPFKLTSSQGIISSPNFDFGNSTYPFNSMCSWTIEAPVDNFISIEFQHFQLQNSFSCGLDALVLYDGLSQEGEFIQALCGFETPQGFTSTRNQLFLLFVTDGFRNYDGFQLTYQFTTHKKYCKPNEMKCATSDLCFSNNKRCNGFDECDDGSDEKNCYYPVNEPISCGYPIFPPSPGNTRIVGGKIAEPGNWPWQTILFSNGDFQCGGALINEEWILTAAHCFKRNSDPSAWTIAVGKQNLNTADTMEQLRAIEIIAVHPLYNPNPSSDPMKIHRDNDIALMKLKKKVFFTDYIRPVCLPTVNAPQPGKDNFTGYVTGFGDTRDVVTYGVLKQAELFVYDQQRCRNSYPGIIADSMFCASWPTGGIDACQGDSGGPFVHQYEGFWHLLGVISWGKDCGKPDQPGVYTEVSCFLQWIEEVIHLNM